MCSVPDHEGVQEDQDVHVNDIYATTFCESLLNNKK